MPKPILKVQMLLTNLINKVRSLNLIYLVFGFLFSIYIFYIRLLLVRLPKELSLFHPTKYMLCFIVLIWVCLSTFVIYKSIKNLLQIPTKETKIQNILNKVHTFIEESLISLYHFIMTFVPECYDRVSQFTLAFYRKFGNIHEGFFLFLSYACRLVIVFSFLFDVFIGFEFRFFYKTLILLCFPLIINIITHVFRDFSDNNLKTIESFLNIQHLNPDKENEKPRYLISPTPGNEDIDLNYTINQYYICSKISGYLQAYDFCVNHYSPYFNICIYGMYLIGWLYVILYNILYLL